MKIIKGTAAAAAIAASMLSVNADAVNLASEGLGEVAIAPYYTVRDGWQTLINLTNTSMNPIAVKVRFHEALNSRDVLDFTVAMSANDSFVGLLTDSPQGPRFLSADTEDATGKITCTVPSSAILSGANNIANRRTDGQLMSTGGFAGSNNGDGGPTDVDRLREGYIEFIVMGETLGSKSGTVVGTDGVINVGNAIEQHDCTNLDLAFGPGNNALAGGTAAQNRRIAQTAAQFVPAKNTLKFNFRLINTSNGVEAGNAAVAWANFFNLGTTTTADLAPEVLLANSNALIGFTNVGGVSRPICSVTRGDDRQDLTSWAPNASATTGLPAVPNGSCPNLVAMQSPQAFLEPSLNDAFPPFAGSLDDNMNSVVLVSPSMASLASANWPTFGAPGAFRGIDAMSATIMRSGIINEWASRDDGAGTGVATDWIVTMPTKGFYVDQGPGVQFAISRVSANGQQSADRPEAQLAGALTTSLAMPYAPFFNRFAQTTVGDPTTAKACNEVSFSIYDRAEQTVGQQAGGPVVSPQPPAPTFSTNLCYEANVITFNGRSALKFNGADVGALNRLRDATGAQTSVNTTVLPTRTIHGWMRMNLAVPQQAAGNAIPQLPILGNSTNAFNVSTALTRVSGLPVVGQLIKVRNFGNSVENFASSTDHGFERTYN